MSGAFPHRLGDAFATTYAEARGKFLAAAAARSLSLESHVNPAGRGVDGEEIASDTVLLGAGDAPALVVLTSAMHGVEGFCGSGCQVELLGDEALLAAVARSGVAVLFHHAVNPWGFSWLRRTNENNVDLNRNFRDFAAPHAQDAAYAEIHSLMVPDVWPPTEENRAALTALVAARGRVAVQAAVSSGQSVHPDGLFYAGTEPQWSNRVLRSVLARHGRSRKRIAWIDFHTGLGPWGHGEKIFSGPDDAAMLARTMACFGADVTSFYDGTSTSAELSGVAWRAALDACPHAEFIGIGLEYGTVPFEDTLAAIRADQWLANHPGAEPAMQASIKAQMRRAFNDDGEAWRAMVYGQARVAVLQAIRALAA
ncbi:MAG: M14 family metallopeptidase [Casimicrobiaceae bacterium]